MTRVEQTGPADSFVLLRDSTNREIRAVLRRVSWHTAVFEVPGWQPVLRLSESLPELQVVLNGSRVYAGKALVTGLIDTGAGCVCETKLEPSWLDRTRVGGNGRLQASVREGFSSFLGSWQKSYRLLEQYKVALADLRSFLEDLRLWLEQAELGLEAASGSDRANRERDLAAELADQVVSAITELFQRFEQAASKVEPEAIGGHRAFAQQQLHPLLLCSPFVRRTYLKPLGYAGDYEMVNMMFRDRFEGATLFGRLVNAYALQLPPIQGHRNRVAMLTDILTSEALRARRENRRFRALSLGCGAAHEIQRFLPASALADISDFVLVDFDEETLSYAGSVLEDIRTAHGRRNTLKLIKQSAQVFVARCERGDRPGLGGGEFDLVYCAGLFDYLSDRICERLLAGLYDLVRPGGLLIATNVDTHPARHEMECFLEWHLIYRNSAELRRLIAPELDPNHAIVRTDATGSNVFLEIRKPEDGKRNPAR